MFKKISLILFIILSFMLASSVANPESITPKQEADLLLYMKGSINDYVQTVNWSESRDYTQEAEKISKIIEKFGFPDHEVVVFVDSNFYPVGIRVRIKSKISNVEYRMVWKARPKSNL